MAMELKGSNAVAKWRSLLGIHKKQATIWVGKWGEGGSENAVAKMWKLLFCIKLILFFSYICILLYIS